MENPVPKNPGIPGFGKIPSRKIPGLKFLITLGPACGIPTSSMILVFKVGVLLQQLGKVLEQAVLRSEKVKLEVPLLPERQH